MENPQWNTLLEKSIAGTNADWAEIDRYLTATDIPDYTVLAGARLILYNLSEHPEAGPRDLAASVLERYPRKIDAIDIQKLEELMVVGQEDIENPYPVFRAACALASYMQTIGSQDLPDYVSSVLRQFAKDKDPAVAKIANDYLNS